MMELFEQKSRVQNFAEPKEVICMGCERKFTAGRGLYERRFCSEGCKLTYLL